MSPGSLDALPLELDIIFHATSPDGSADSAYRAACVEGLRNLLRVLEARRERPGRVILVSSTRVYGQRRGEWVDETSPTESEGHTGRRLLEGERVALGGPFPASVMRAGAIERAMNGFSDVRSPSYANLIHRDDLAGALRHLMLLPELDECCVVWE